MLCYTSTYLNAEHENCGCSLDLTGEKIAALLHRKPTIAMYQHRALYTDQSHKIKVVVVYRSREGSMSRSDLYRWIIIQLTGAA